MPDLDAAPCPFAVLGNLAPTRLVMGLVGSRIGRADAIEERPQTLSVSVLKIGLPWQVIVGPRGIASGTVELKRRSSGEKHELSVESALARLAE